MEDGGVEEAVEDSEEEGDDDDDDDDKEADVADEDEDEDGVGGDGDMSVDAAVVGRTDMVDACAAGHQVHRDICR